MRPRYRGDKRVEIVLERRRSGMLLAAVGALRRSPWEDDSTALEIRLCGFHIAQMLLQAGVAVIGLDNLNDYYDPP